MIVFIIILSIVLVTLLFYHLLSIRAIRSRMVLLESNLIQIKNENETKVKNINQEFSKNNFYLNSSINKLNNVVNYLLNKLENVDQDFQKYKDVVFKLTGDIENLKEKEELLEKNFKMISEFKVEEELLGKIRDLEEKQTILERRLRYLESVDVLFKKIKNSRSDILDIVNRLKVMSKELDINQDEEVKKNA